MTAPVIEVRNLYKVFGPRAAEMMPYLREGMTKEDLLKETGHVLGLRDISFSVAKGGIYASWVCRARASRRLFAT